MDTSLVLPYEKRIQGLLPRPRRALESLAVGTGLAALAFGSAGTNETALVAAILGMVSLWALTRAADMFVQEMATLAGVERAWPLDSRFVSERQG
jgi:hypothetical protein